MALVEVQFPTGISYGSSGGPGFSTSIVETDSGAEERIARWSGARRRYNVGEGIKSFQDLSDINEFFIARQGPAVGFRYKDFMDSSSSANGLDTSIDGGVAPTKDDQQIGIGDASKTQFQLVKLYTSGPVTRTRNIEKPVIGTVLIALDGVNQTSGFSVNTVTGLVTFTVAPGAGVVITAGFEFDVPVRFGEGVGQALMVAIDNFSSGSIAGITVVEIRDENEISDEFFFGGAKELPMVADTTITTNDGRVIRCSPIAIFKLFLPLLTPLASGGPYFYLFNDGSASVDVRDSGDTLTVVTLGTSASVVLCISELSGVKTWRVF